MKKVTILFMFIVIGAIVLFQADEAESNVIPNSAKRFVENVENAAENIIEGVAEKIGFAAGSAKEKADIAQDSVKETAENAKENLRDNANYAKDKVNDYSDRVRRNTNTAAENIRDKSRHAKDKFASAKEKVGTYAENAKENVKDNVENVKEKVGEAKEKVGEYAEDLKEGATNFAGNVKEKIGEAKEKVVNVAENIAEKVLPEEVIDMVDPLSDTIQGGVNKMKRNLANLKSYKDSIVKKLFPVTDEALLMDLQDKTINENELIVEWAKREGYNEIVPILIEKNYDLEKLGSLNTSNIKDELKVTDQSYALRIIDSIDSLFEIVNPSTARSTTTGDFVTPVEDMIL